MSEGKRDPVHHFARTNHRMLNRLFGIKHADRLSHMYIIGRTGTGKSTLIETLVLQDIAAGHGLALIDPHGDLVSRVAGKVPKQRRSDLVYFDATNPRLPYGYNPLKRVKADQRPLAASGMLEVFEKLWDGKSWGARMEHLLRYSLLALLDQPAATLPDLLRLLFEKEYRQGVIANVQNEQVRVFWTRDFPADFSPRLRSEAFMPVINKVSSFLADPRLYRILTKPEHELSPRRIMDSGQILLVNLSKGLLGEDMSSLLGGLLVSTIGLAAFSRADTDEEDRRDFFLYIDEFQSFTTRSLVEMASELRKFGIGMVWAHQYLHQLEPEIKHAVLGNAGTLISFRLGAEDAAFIAREFEPKFDAVDLLSLPNHDIYLKLLIDGSPSQPFSATTVYKVSKSSTHRARDPNVPHPASIGSTITRPRPRRIR